MAEEKPIRHSHRLKDITGQKFGRLTALSISHNNSEGRPHWLCLCDCGRRVAVAGRYLRKGKTISCGCAKAERFRAMVTKHGKCDTPEYKSWSSAKDRCFNPRNKKYPDYGGRGITMDAAWHRDFQAFLDHIGLKPEGCTLDRIDNEQGYIPGNVRWAADTTQVRNRRKTIMITHDGLTLSLPEWAERLGMPYHSLKSRYYKRPDTMFD